MYLGFDKVTLEREYSPSSCVDDINVYLEQYAAQSKTAKYLALENESVLVDVAYGDSQGEVLDLFLPVQTAKKKLHIYIHGGYWQALSKDESCFAANNFQSHGVHFAVLDYALAPTVTLTEIIEQNRRAIAYLYSMADEYGYDRNEIYISGSSAGGHLVMTLLQTNWSEYLSFSGGQEVKINGVCAVSGIYDITPIKDTYIDEPLSLTNAELENCSPLKHNQTQLCPVIIAYGEIETSEFKRQSQAMFTKLQHQDIDCLIHEVDGRNHFNVITELGQPDSSLFHLVKLQMAL